MAIRSFVQVGLVLLSLASAAAFAGCAPNLECAGSRCMCRSGDCRQSCPQGGCDLQCQGTNCELDCAGGGCRLQCDPGAQTCVIRNCTTNCNVQCNGAPTCTNSCDVFSSCVTQS